jgi:hypothetical protein
MLQVSDERLASLAVHGLCHFVSHHDGQADIATNYSIYKITAFNTLSEVV